MEKFDLTLVKNNFQGVSVLEEIIAHFKSTFSDEELKTPIVTFIAGWIGLEGEAEFFWSNGSQPRDIAYLTDTIKSSMLITKH